jgi:hypothetical protein
VEQLRRSTAEHAAEVERLRRRNAELVDELTELRAGRPARRDLAATRPHRSWPRTAVASVLVVLGTLLVLLTVPVVWARAQVLDTDKYLQTVGPLARDPVVQDEIATKATDALLNRIDVAGLVRDNLPPVAQPLAGPIAQGVRQFVSTTAHDFTRSEAFPRMWLSLNRVGHEQVVAVLTGKGGGAARVDASGRLFLNLGPVIDEVKQRVAAAGLSFVASLPSINPVVEVAKVPGLVKARTLVNWLDRLATWLPWLGLACLAGAVALRRGRRAATLLTVALSVFAAMLALRVGLTLGREAAVSRVPGESLSPVAVAQIFDTVTGGLRAGLRVVAVAALLLALAAWLSGSSRAATSTRAGVLAAVRWARTRSRLGPNRVGTRIAAHRTALRAVVLATAGLVLLFGPQWTPALLVTVAVVTALALLIVEFLAARPADTGP